MLQPGQDTQTDERPDAPARSDAPGVAKIGLRTAGEKPQHDPVDEGKNRPDDFRTSDPDGADADEDTSDKDEHKLSAALVSLRKHRVAFGALTVVFIGAIVAGVLWYLHARHFESTDDAFIDGRPATVSPEVTGKIVSVPVNDNQLVRAGDLLAKIDARDYQAAVQQADALIEQAEASIANYQAQVEAQNSQIEGATHQVDEAKATLSFSNDQNTRGQQLLKTGFGTVQTAQQTASDLVSKTAALDAAKSAQLSAERQVNVLKAQIKGAQGQLNQARAQKATADANLSRTELHAAIDGRVTRLTAAVGAISTQGQALMVLVPLDLWVTANFKETQLADMRVGQSVSIEVDAYGRTLPGHIDSIQAGSGTAFSLLPAENATGNYVKVVQRVPVKITFDKRPDIELGPGMSVGPRVSVR